MEGSWSGSGPLIGLYWKERVLDEREPLGKLVFNYGALLSEMDLNIILLLQFL